VLVFGMCICSAINAMFFFMMYFFGGGRREKFACDVFFLIFFFPCMICASIQTHSCLQGWMHVCNLLLLQNGYAIVTA
jgi:hypothetical protein